MQHIYAVWTAGVGNLEPLTLPLYPNTTTNLGCPAGVALVAAVGQRSQRHRRAHRGRRPHCQPRSCPSRQRRPSIAAIPTAGATATVPAILLCRRAGSRGSRGGSASSRCLGGCCRCGAGRALRWASRSRQWVRHCCRIHRQPCLGGCEIDRAGLGQWARGAGCRAGGWLGGGGIRGVGASRAKGGEVQPR